MKNRTLGKYSIIRRLGKGGMGIVFKAMSPVIDKVVAIKVLDPSEVLEITMGSDQLNDIFLTEAKTLAGLHHQNLVTIWDFDYDDAGRPYFVMEYYCNNLGVMIGESFQVEKKSRLIPPEKVIHYGFQILDALAYLHHNNIVHRDIKPYNLLVTDSDTVKICDFGMSLVDGVSFNGPENMQIGSPCYTPPEQKKTPHQVDGRADCYSTAVLLYRMLTGTLPGMQSFPLSIINPLYDSKWDDFFRIGLSWNPGDRFQNAAQMQSALNKLNLRWQQQKAHSNQKSTPSVNSVQKLRSTPENRCGARALDHFKLTTLYRPYNYIRNQLTKSGKLVIDQSTNLIWQNDGSPYPLSWHGAEGYIRHLNKIRYAELAGWRLPTTDELMSLLDEPSNQPDSAFFDSTKKWVWSCDLHGKSERWFVNLDMGYASTQDKDCLNFIRAVNSNITI